MTWIKTVPFSEAGPELREAARKQRGLYPPEYSQPVEALREADAEGGIVGSHTLIPDALYHAFATFGSLMSPDLPLSRRQHEMIAATVSILNKCFY